MENSGYKIKVTQWEVRQLPESMSIIRSDSRCWLTYFPPNKSFIIKYMEKLICHEYVSSMFDMLYVLLGSITTIGAVVRHYLKELVKSRVVHYPCLVGEKTEDQRG